MRTAGSLDSKGAARHDPLSSLFQRFLRKRVGNLRRFKFMSCDGAVRLVLRDSARVPTPARPGASCSPGEQHPPGLRSARHQPAMLAASPSRRPVLLLEQLTRCTWNSGPLTKIVLEAVSERHVLVAVNS